MIENVDEKETPHNVFKNFRDIFDNFASYEKEYTSLVDLIDKTNDENLEDVFNQIVDKIDFIPGVFNVIEYAIFIRPHQMKSLFSLFCRLSDKIHFIPRDKVGYRGQVLSEHSTDEFKLLLKHKDMINLFPLFIKDKSDEEIFSIFPTGTLERTIKDDNVSGFVDIISQHYFDPQERIKIDQRSPICYTYDVYESLDETFKYEYESFTLMQVICFFGAVKCFKVVIASEIFTDESNVENCAVAGGNYEIIHILEQRGHTFDNCFKTAVRFHRHDICDWIFNNYKYETFPISCTIEAFNDRAFYFFIHNNLPIYKNELKHCLFLAAKSGHLPIVKFLLENKNEDVNGIDAFNSTPLHYAAKFGHLNLVKYLIEERKADHTVRDIFGLTPLHYASKSGCLDVVKYFIEIIHMDADDQYKGRVLVNYQSNYLTNSVPSIYYIDQNRSYCFEYYEIGYTPLHYAVANGSIELIKYFVEECHSNVNTTRPTNNNTLLHTAAEQSNLDAIKYLYENCKLNINAQNNKGYSPLSLAIQQRHCKIIKYLVEECHAFISDNDLKSFFIDSEIEEYLKLHKENSEQQSKRSCRV